MCGVLMTGPAWTKWLVVCTTATPHYIFLPRKLPEFSQEAVEPSFGNIVEIESSSES